MVNFSDDAVAAIKELESDASDVCFLVLGFGDDFGKTLGKLRHLEDLRIHIQHPDTHEQCFRCRAQRRRR